MSIIKRTGIAVLAVAVALAVTGSDALAKGKKGAGKGASGTVTAVDKSSLTIESKKHGSKQFQLTSDTTYEWKGKKHQPGAPATLDDVKNGERVRIAASGGQATKVVISKAKS